MDSVNHYRIGIQLKGKGPLEVIWSSPPSQAGPPYRRLTKTMSSELLIISKDGDFTVSLGNTVAVNHLSEKCFLMSRGHFLCSSLCPFGSGPVTGHHWQKPSSIFSALSFQVFRYIDHMSLSLLQAQWSQHSQFFLRQMLQFLKRIHGPLL